MNVAMFALVFLTSGYVFMRLWQLSRSHLMRSEGHTLYFLAVWAALLVGLLSIIVTHDLLSIPWIGNPFRDFVAASLKAYLIEDKNVENIVRFGTAALVSVPLSLTLAWALNVPLRSSASLCPDLLFRISSVSELESFLWNATKRSLSVMISLSGGKVYVGNAIESPAPGEQKNWVRIEPLLSGCRDENLQFKLTTSYFWIYDPSKRRESRDLSVEDFDILLPIDQIQSVHPFDIEAYQKHFRTGVEVTDKAAVENNSNLELRPRHRLMSYRKISFPEWTYLAYITFIIVSPVLFFLHFNRLGIASLGFAAGLGRGFVTAGRERRKKLAEATRSPAVNPSEKK